MTKIGRNDPCSCGSGKKYKQCCMLKEQSTGPKRKFKATVLTQTKPINLMERTYGQPVVEADDLPPTPPPMKNM